jgi:hypothetical protein
MQEHQKLSLSVFFLSTPVKNAETFHRSPPPHPPPSPLPLPHPSFWHTLISIRINKLSKTFLITGTAGLAWLYYQGKFKVRIPPWVWFGKKSWFGKCLTNYNFFN